MLWIAGQSLRSASTPAFAMRESVEAVAIDCGRALCTAAANSCSCADASGEDLGKGRGDYRCHPRWRANMNARATLHGRSRDWLVRSGLRACLGHKLVSELLPE